MHTVPRLRALLCATVAALFVALAALLAEEAAAKAPITALRAEPASTQAGAHSDVIARLGQNSIGDIEVCDCHVVRDITVNTPPGVVGTPNNIPTCTAVEITANHCPIDSQVGLMGIHLWNDPEFHSAQIVPLYNMVPTPNELARLAFPVPLSYSNSINISVKVRTESDYGLEFKTFGIPRILPNSGFTQFNWGVPGDSRNDIMRFGLNEEKSGGCFFPGMTDVAEAMLSEPPACRNHTGTPVPSNSSLSSFLNNPTTCSGSLTVTGETLAYDTEIDFAEATFPALTGCDKLTFNPSLSAKPTTTEADAPSGLDVELTIPQILAPDTQTPSAIRDLAIELPPGFSVNANAADGKSACTAAEAMIGTRKEAHCPQNAKIATLEVESSSFPSILPGAMYVGEPLPGERYRVFMTFDGFSLHVKLPGTALLDPATGQVTVTFKDLPQFNFQRFNAHVFGSERGLFSTPEQCGTYPVHATYRPWAYPDLPEQTSTQFFKIDSGSNGEPCPAAQRPFSPQLSAGVTDNTGGHHTDFVFDLTRKDGDQYLSTTAVKTPPGFSGVLANIPYCPEATLSALAQSAYLGMTQQAAPACPQSKVGTSDSSAGSGSRPVSLPGSVYLSGPYKGAPLSLAIVTPAVSGPYDLGNVVVRVAIAVNPLTAQVTAISDPLPMIVEGIPLRLRRILVMLDRENFALNPTNCSPLSVDAQVGGDQGGLADLENYFQAANCGALDFAPRLGLKLRGSTKRRGHPALRSVLRGTPNGANLSGVVVAMPSAELLDQAHIGTVCTRVQFAADNCPKASVYGKAMAKTPLLDESLRGPVYLRSSSHELPDLVVALKGQVDLELVGRIDTTKSKGLRTTFETAPDAPVTKFVLNLKGGAKGLLQNSEDLCRSPKRASVRLFGQNGKQISRRTRLQTSCAKKSKKRRARRASLSTTRKAG